MHPEPHLLERESELRLLAALNEAALEGHGRALIIDGDAGIGKSRLLEATRTRAAPELTVLAARGGELEQDFSYGVVRQLFEPVLARLSDSERVRVLGDAAAPAASALGLRGEKPPPGPDASFALQHALYWFVINLSANWPLLLCVDDLHWADEASFRWLIHLTHRLEGLPVSIAAGWRRGEHGAREDLLAALRAEPNVETLSPDALSETACAAIVRSALGPEADTDFSRACFKASGGNPFLLGELVGLLASERVAPTGQSVSRVASLSPDGVSASLLVRLARLPFDAGALARAVAVLENDAELRLAAAVADIDEKTAADAAERLAGARILAADTPLRFAHPILRTAVHDDLSRPVRSLLHRRAAQLLAAEDRHDRAAIHLMRAEPAGDRRVVASLREAARRSSVRGAPAGASALLSRALREPPARDEHFEVLLELGTAQRAGGDPAASLTLRQALELAPDAAGRERAGRELAHVQLLGGHVDEGMEVLEQLLAELPEDTREARTRLELDLITLGLSSQAHARRMGDRLAAMAAGAKGETTSDRIVLATFAVMCAATRHSTAERMGPLVDRAWGDGQLLEDVGPSHVAVYYVAYAMSLTDRLQEAWEVCDRAAAQARTAGSVSSLASAMANRGRIAWWKGDVLAAEADSAEALHFASLAGMELGRYFAVGHLVFALTARGELAAAERELASHVVLQADPPPDMQSAVALQSRAHLRIAQGRWEDARRDIEEVFSRAADRGAITVSWSWRAFVLSCLALGDVPAARDAARRGLESTRRFGCPSDIGILLGLSGLAEGGQAGIDMLREAAAIMEKSPRRLDAAEALVDLGAALRRANQRSEAREPLRRALDVANGLDAVLVARRAHEELRACGARPRRLMLSGPNALTGSERRVAQMAADGLTNREIAQVLFVTPKTVETHLRATYRKLGIESRTQLRDALSTPPAPSESSSEWNAEAGPQTERATVQTLLLTEIMTPGERAAELGAHRWAQALAHHDEAVRDEVRRHRGHVVKGGSGFLATFDSSTRALRCAVAVLGRLRGVDLEIRAGVHTGECYVAGGSVHGSAVDVAARVLDRAGPGEVLLSGIAQAIADASGLTFLDRGSHRLEGVPGECGLYAVADAQPKTPDPGPRMPAGS